MIWTAAAALLASAPCARADDGLGTQLEISSMIPDHHESSGAARSDTWALLPEIGYSPDQKLNGGFKFTGRNLTEADITLDTEFNAAMEHQLGIDASVLFPHVMQRRGIILGEYHYYLSPDKDFFGLGNNHQRSPLSVHSIERQRGLVTLAYHLRRDLLISGSAGVRETRFARSPEAGGSLPATGDVFPGLVGLNGGRTNPIIGSLIYNNRQSITRPTLGWSAMGTIEHVNLNLGNDFHFTRFTLDASYLHPLPDRDHVFGVHFNGEHIEGRDKFVPFFELASLGGANNMRGFFPDRFLGKDSLLLNSEYRVKLSAFNFRHVWDVQIDSVFFGDMGRVYITTNEVSQDLRVKKSRVSEIFEEFRYSYGTGLRIALGEAIVARIDVGFSNEQVGLVYLVFGQAF